MVDGSSLEQKYSSYSDVLELRHACALPPDCFATITKETNHPDKRDKKAASAVAQNPLELDTSSICVCVHPLCVHAAPFGKTRRWRSRPASRTAVRKATATARCRLRLPARGRST
ncbi:hypothetical protein STCU_10016 [Strigomonas culicis]|uniref:Uncharacterized protein n=1 Tax=Strigomonas culicis TaxID=28005 RepID=S9V622_9TRYP|nr:hypothetical protein STCU_10016 [Strigomonas culicis]|eukprot:EPY18360.1 hypothetical protein STCU_10016 [Strigomonas culicis]